MIGALIICVLFVALWIFFVHIADNDRIPCPYCAGSDHENTYCDKCKNTGFIKEI